MPGMMMMMNPPGPDEGNNFIMGYAFTNRIGEHRSMGGRIVLGGILNAPDRITKVGSSSTDIRKVGSV